MKFILLFALVFSLLFVSSACRPDVKEAEAKPEVLKVDEVVKVFQKANLPLGQLEFFVEKSDPEKLLGKPNQYTGKVFWQTKKDMTHGLESFSSDEDLQARKRYFEADKKTAGDFFYVHKNILVRIHKDMLPETAAKFEQALKSM